MPDDYKDIFNGFKRDNAYFIGAERMKVIKYTKAQFCGGYRANTDWCPRVKCYDIKDNLIAKGVPYPANINDFGFSNDMTKAIVWMAGGGVIPTSEVIISSLGDLRFPIGYADDPAPMDTYGNAETGEIKYWCRSTGDIQSDRRGWSWHFRGYGWSGLYKNVDDELLLDPNTPHRCGNTAHMPKAVAEDKMQYMNLFQLRVK